MVREEPAERRGTPRGRLRGWGGVAAMAVACALAAALLPLARHEADRGGDAPAATHAGADAAEHRPGASRARTSADESCKDPEAGLRPSGKSGPAVDAIKKRGYLIAGVDQNSYRWGYRNPATGRLEGFDIDLVTAIAEDILGEDAKVVYRAIPTNQRIPALEQRTVDIIARTMTINCDRVRHVAFSTAYFQAGQQVLVPKGSSVTAFDGTLRGKRVCTAAGSTGEAELRKESHGARITTVPNQLDCLVRLQLGEADAVVTDNALAAGQAAQDPSVTLVGEPFTEEPYGVAMNLEDEDLVRRVNKVLEDYRESGAWMKAYKRWLASDLKGITGPPEPKYRKG
ncbi:glutamate ABC transporter substrate-binding protein [Streptomyces sp. NPDC048639]|uniref:glutamate ABC transporter substrate-binding protein n=1 Tax=Streptomyces sp. NPDC048639 TaxID=3365581 RepID=UPI00371E38C2